jgi:predicted component of type VI protein secretion system
MLNTTPSPNIAGTTQAARESDIAHLISAACRKITSDLDDKFTAQDAVSALTEGVTNARMAIALEIANASVAGDWKRDEIARACKHAVRLSNRKPPETTEHNQQERDDYAKTAEARTEKTVATFISEVALYAHPKVREKFPTIMRACADAWEAENALIADTDKEDRHTLNIPCHKFSKRLYHLTTQITRAVRHDEAQIENVLNVIAYCAANDPDHNADKIAKRVEAITSLLRAMHNDFGLEKLLTCVGFLDTISADQLQASRAAKLAAEEAARQKLNVTPVAKVTTVAKVAPVVVAPVVTAPVVAPVIVAPVVETGVAEGAVDTLGELLNDPPVTLQTAA